LPRKVKTTKAGAEVRRHCPLVAEKAEVKEVVEQEGVEKAGFVTRGLF
jgi:hypothetical protein